MSYEHGSADEVNHADLTAPKETLLLRYVSSVTGHTYDEEMVDRLADMVLIFYAAGGTVLGAIVGCGSSLFFLANKPWSTQSLLVVLATVCMGAFLGCIAVMAVLNVRGLVRWDNFIVRRTATLKEPSPAKRT